MIPPGGVNFVDVRDAAAAFESALSRGRAGERYLLGGPNWSFETFFARLSRVWRQGTARQAAGADLLLRGQSGRRLLPAMGPDAPVDRTSVEMGQRFWWLDSSKAERELGFQARDPYETLYETVAYIRKEFLSQAVLS